MKNDSILIHDMPHQSLVYQTNHPIRSFLSFPFHFTKGETHAWHCKYQYFRKSTLTLIWLIRFCYSFPFSNLFMCISFSLLHFLLHLRRFVENFQVAWIHIDRQMILTIHRHVISKIPRYSITYDNANTWQLHVNQAQQEDRG